MKEKNLHHATDQQLLDEFYELGNTQLLGILLQRYTLLLLGVCMKYLKNEEAAKDAVQQIFLKVINELKRYKVQYFKSWLYMIAKNYCLMQLRNKTQHITLDANENLPDDEPALLHQSTKEELLTLIEICLPQLNAEQQTCIHLFYIEKKNYNQVSTETGYSIMQVKSYIQNGKRNLRLMIEKKLKQQ